MTVTCFMPECEEKARWIWAGETLLCDKHGREVRHSGAKFVVEMYPPPMAISPFSNFSIDKQG